MPTHSQNTIILSSCSCVLTTCQTKKNGDTARVNSKDHRRVELVSGEVTAELKKFMARKAKSRNSSFPKGFHRWFCVKVRTIKVRPHAAATKCSGFAFHEPIGIVHRGIDA